VQRQPDDSEPGSGQRDRRPAHLLGRLFGTTGWDPTDYAQWTEYFVRRPLGLAMWTTAGVVLGLFLGLAISSSDWVYYGLAAVGGLVGVAFGGWRYLRRHPVD
jgi:hypothetical protein